MALLSLNDIHKSFGGLRVLDGISFDVERGSITALIGPNGAGKTTLINIISGLLPANEGNVVFESKRIDGLPAHQVAERGIARTFQILKVFKDMSVLENVMVGGHLAVRAGLASIIGSTSAANSQERRCREQALDVLESLGLRDCAGRLMGELPHGQQRLIDLGRALMSKPKLILLDEPCAGLTHRETDEFRQRMEMIQRSAVTIFLVEHNMHLVMGCATRIIVLSHGELISDGPPEHVSNDPAVIEAYLGRKAQRAQG